MLKILHIAIPTEAGGLERVVEALAVGHHRRRHDVTVAIVRLALEESSLPPMVETLRSAGLRVPIIRVAPRNVFAERRQIAGLCRRIRPDVVHTHGVHIDLVDRGAVARLGVPTVTTVHGPSMLGGWKGAFYEWLQRRNYRRFDAVVAVSSKLREETLADGVTPDRLYCIPNAWGGLREPLARGAARRELGLDGNATIVGWVGRFIPVKGADLFLEALSRLPPPRPIGVLIGYGPEMNALRQKADELGIGSLIQIYPDVRDAGRLFAAFDTYVLSSRSEGLPIVLLEAMAAGTPIVATMVGGIPDALSEDEAWLVPPSDPNALAKAIAESLGNRSRAVNRASRAAKRLAVDFAFDTWLDRYEQVYRAAMGRRRRTLPSAVS